MKSHGFTVVKSCPPFCFTISRSKKLSRICRSLSATLQIRDLLKTGKWEFTTEGPDFYNHNIFRRDPLYALTLTYNINNYKEKKQNNTPVEEENGNGGEMEGGGEEF